MAQRGNGAIAGASKKNTSKRDKKKSFKNTRLFKIVRIVIVIMILIGIWNTVEKLTHKTPEKVSVVIGDKKVELMNDVIVDKYNNIFISMNDIKNLYDNNIYYSNNMLITTFNKHIAVLEIGKTTMRVNDVVQEIKGTLKETNGIIYLPFSDMEDVYDFTKYYNKETKILSIDSKSEEKKEAVVLKNVNLKESAKGFSKTIEKVKKTGFVTVFETEGDFTKVRTKAGNIGYIPTKKLSEPKILWETMDEEKLENVTVLEEYAIVDSNYQQLSNIPQDAIVMPKLFNIIENEENEIQVENIIELDSEKFKAYKEWTEANGVSICGVVTLDCNMSKISSSYESRSYVINTLYNDLVTSGIRMFCVDFSVIDDAEGLYRLLIEMMPRFKCAGMKVLVKENNSFNGERVRDIVDYVVN